MYEIRTEGSLGSFLPTLGSFQGFLTWGSSGLAIIYPGGHLSLLGLE